MPSDGSSFGSFFKEVGAPFNHLGKQMMISSQLDNTSNTTNINQSAGTKLSIDLRKKVLKDMPKKLVKQKGGKMIKTFKIGSGKYRCAATMVGKSCRYEIRAV
jgi:hypothetical protein